MYPGRLLLVGLLGASVVRTAPPPPAVAPAEPSVEIAIPRSIRGQLPPVPGARAERWGGPATVVTFNQNVDLRVVRGGGPEPPGASVRRDLLGHTGAEPVVEVGLFLGRSVAGDDPPVPDARTLHWQAQRAGIEDHRLEKLHRVVAGEDPPVPEAQVDRRLVGRSGIADHRLKIQHRTIPGEAPTPEARTERWQVEHTGAEPPIAPALSLRRTVAGADPPVPEARIVRPIVQRPAIADHRLDAHRVVTGEAPVPEARISRTQVLTPPAVENLFVGRRFVQGDPPPVPEGIGSRLPVQRAAVADHRLKAPHSFTVGEAPTPDSRILRWGLEHTGAVIAAVPSIFVGSRHLTTDYNEEARIGRWGQFHTGQPIIQTEFGFLGRAFIN